MNIVIFSGGSGSAEHQKNIFELYPEANVIVLTNGYDNGKSTGLIRTVFDGKILGPSDIRKNQTRHYSFKHGKDSIFNFIEHRFTSDSPLEYIAEYFSTLAPSNKLIILMNLVKEYFTLPQAYNITYEDFSIGNIIYGYLAYKNNYSMQAAADYMKDLLELPYETIVNSDESLFLSAITESGKIISDEADIVDYNNSNDKIIDIFFNESKGFKRDYSILNNRSVKALKNADIIIFSSGTQWSSLFPTYKSCTEYGMYFKEFINNIPAKKYLIMNATEDKDMIGLSADNILDIINEKYINIDNVKVMISSNASNDLCNSIKYKDNSIIGLYSFNNKHTKNIILDIFYNFFNNPTTKDLFIFDWDDTLVGRQGKYTNISTYNVSIVKAFNSYVVTGNSHLKIKFSKYYADSSLNYYEDGKFIRTIKPEFKITNEIKNIVESAMLKFGFNISMLQNRGETCLSIKPIKDETRKLLTYILNQLFKETEFKAFESGLTTIDITHKNTSKLFAVKDIIEHAKKEYNRIFYIGDEYEDGNDKIIFDNKDKLNIITIPVKNPIHTKIFIDTIRKG